MEWITRRAFRHVVSRPSKTERSRRGLASAEARNPSCARRATGLPLTLAIIGGNPDALQAFRRSLSPGAREARAAALPVAVHSPGHVADTTRRRGTSSGRTTRR